MIRITPEQFRDAFREIASPLATELSEAWFRSKDYTTLVRAKILPAIADRLRLQIYNGDYYTLDAILYEAKDSEHFASHLTYATYIAVAIEHENDSKTSLIEINKLQLFNTPLKVLITYDSKNRMTKQLIAAYSKMVRAADVFGDFANGRRTLVIIGDLDTGTPRWQYFTFDGENFVEMS